MLEAADISYSIWDFLWPLKSMMLACVDSIVVAAELKELQCCLEIESMRFGLARRIVLRLGLRPPFAR